MNVGCHAGAFSWAIFAGSHLPEADEPKLSLLASSGIRSVKYLLYESDQARETQYEDIRRLRQEFAFSEIVFRLMHGNTLPSPADHWERYKPRIKHAIDLGYRVIVQPVNEPNLELPGMAPADLAAWFVQFKQCVDLPVELVSPPLAPYAPNTWAWWDGMRQAVSAADTVGVHVYAKDADALQGAYSLPWWLAQAPGKAVRVLECGSPTGTAAPVRAATLPLLYAQLSREARVLSFHPFILSSENVEHAEHWYTDAIITSLRQCAQGVTPTLPPSDDSGGGSDDSSDDSSPFVGSFVLTVAGHEIPFSIRRA